MWFIGEIKVLTGECPPHFTDSPKPEDLPNLTAATTSRVPALEVALHLQKAVYRRTADKTKTDIPLGCRISLGRLGAESKGLRCHV